MTWRIYSKHPSTGLTVQGSQTDYSAQENIQLIRRSKAYTTVLDVEGVVLIWHRVSDRDDVVIYLKADD